MLFICQTVCELWELKGQQMKSERVCFKVAGTWLAINPCAWCLFWKVLRVDCVLLWHRDRVEARWALLSSSVNLGHLHISLSPFFSPVNKASYHPLHQGVLGIKQDNICRSAWHRVGVQCFSFSLFCVPVFTTM